MVLPLSTMCWRYPSGTILLYTIFKGQPESRTLSSFWIYLFYYVKFLPNGSTTLPWCWCLPTAASTLSSTPPNTMSSRRRSNVSCPSRFSQRGRSPATLEKEDNHQLILVLWLCYWIFMYVWMLHGIVRCLHVDRTAMCCLFCVATERNRKSWLREAKVWITD